MAGVPFNSYHGPDSGPLPPGVGMAFPGSPFPMGYAQSSYGYPDFYSAGYGQPGFAAPPYPFSSTHPAPLLPIKAVCPESTSKINSTASVFPRLQLSLSPLSLPRACLYNRLHTPWLANSPLYPHDVANHRKFFVPSTMTVKDMMQQLGCSNKDPDKNVMTEVQEVGNGKWTKGMVFKGGNGGRMKMTLASLGWEMGEGGPGCRVRDH
ncbi:hypothetical protein H4I95_03739 [Botrytis cinerea]